MMEYLKYHYQNTSILSENILIKFIDIYYGFSIKLSENNECIYINIIEMDNEWPV